MIANLWVFLLIWGVWILIPIFVDGIQTIISLLVTLVSAKRKPEHVSSAQTSRSPQTISVVIPAYNEEHVIDRCINSLKIQSYPHHLIDIVAVDDGSEDQTVEILNGHVNGNGNGNGKVKINGNSYPVGDFGGVLRVIANSHQGKAKALNAGIQQVKGELVLCIDSDVVLAPDAVEKIVRVFQENDELVAATAHLEIDSQLLQKNDELENLDSDGPEELVFGRLSWLEKFLAQSQSLEYLNAFRTGRQAESTVNGLFTLAGACSAFRRKALLNTPLYRNSTVSEDTDLTFNIHRLGGKIGYMPDVKIYLEPVVDWDELYAQRVRWQRGQLEVCSLHRDMLGNWKNGIFSWLLLPLRLQTDHTMAFPRLIWTFLLPLFPFLGYPLRIIFLVIVLMFLFYVLIEYLHIGASYILVDEDSRKQVRKAATWGFLMPFYRLITFYYRMSGMLVVLTEPPRWRRMGPAERWQNGAASLGNKVAKGWQSVLLKLSIVLKTS